MKVIVIFFNGLFKYFKIVIEKLLALVRKRPIYHRHSYSQEGEDMILSRLFKKDKGFYIDVGAHHPQRFSNTYYFYLKGWRGINVDAMPGSMDIFKKVRPKDINLEIPISDRREILTYYIFNEPAFNTFAHELPINTEGYKRRKLIAQKELQAYTLSEVLDRYLPENQNIDFMNVDVEGWDYKVLRSNNWGKYSPEIILVEDHQVTSMEEANNSQICRFMLEKDYKLYCKTVNTLIFKKAKRNMQ
jgi:FkbM family methyltransferase